MNWTGNGRDSEFFDAAGGKCLKQLVMFPTHVKGNTLDLVLTNAEGEIHELTAEGRLGKSDHIMVMIQLMGTKDNPQASCGPDWNRADWDSMRLDLRGVDWYRTRPPNKPVWMNR